MYFTTIQGFAEIIVGEFVIKFPYEDWHASKDKRTLRQARSTVALQLFEIYSLKFVAKLTPIISS